MVGKIAGATALSIPRISCIVNALIRMLLDAAIILKRNYVSVSGRGERWLVFAHGFGCDQKMWRFVAPAFEDDFRVVRFDYVGAGRSDGAAYDPVRYGSLEGYASDVIEVIDALGAREVVFVGHSVSGVVGLLASIRRRDLFSHLILVCPSPCYINRLPGYEGGFNQADIEGLLDLMDKNPLGWAGFLAPMVMKNADRPELGAELEQSFCAMKPEVARQFARVTFFSDNRDDLVKVQTPTHVLQCTNDSVAPESVGRFVHRQISGSTFHQLSASGHCPHVSDPEETIRAIRSYLQAARVSPEANRRA